MSYGNPTITAIRDRIRAMLALITDDDDALVLGTDVTDGNLVQDLPAYLVVAGPATWRANGSPRWLVTRTYEVWVFVTRITDVNNNLLIRQAFADCEPIIPQLVNYFHQHPGLELNGVPLVSDVDDIGDSGAAQSPPLNASIYSAFRLLIPVTTVAP